ncbi:MAG TPA: hypothetical protein VNI77_00895, partial [Nitrososphaera sp.]|nr:hypothetical protein [Nitrososphaera sp.]
MSILAAIIITHYRLALAASVKLLPVLFTPAFGQEIEPRALLGDATEDDPQLNATGTELPLLEQMWAKGIHLVQLRRPQVTMN